MVQKLTAVQWLVLDNLKNGWHYRTNLNAKLADDSYEWCVANGYVKQSRITPEGLAILLLCRDPKNEC